MEEDRREAPRGGGHPLQEGRQRLGSILRGLRDDAATLVRKEIALARTEVNEKVHGVSRQSTYLAAGGVLAYTGLCFLFVALSGLLYAAFREADFSPAMALASACSVVGFVLLLVGGGLAAKGRQGLKSQDAKLETTRRSMEETRQWAQDKVG